MAEITPGVDLAIYQKLDGIGPCTFDELVSGYRLIPGRKCFRRWIGSAGREPFRSAARAVWIR